MNSVFAGIFAAGLLVLPAMAEEDMAQVRFNTAVVSADGPNGIHTEFQQFGVSIASKIVGVTSTPAIGAERTIEGRDLLLYRETAIHELTHITPATEVTLGKGKRAKTFSAQTSYDLMLLDGTPAICEFDEPKKTRAADAGCPLPD